MGSTGGLWLNQWTRARIAIGILGVALAVGLAVSNALSPIELASVDARFAVRGAQPARARRFLIVAIDDPTLNALGSYPIHRRYYAKAVARLRAEGARVVALDVQFTEPSDKFDDNTLILGLRRHPGTFLVTTGTVAGGGNDVLGGARTQRFAHVRVASALFPQDTDTTIRQFHITEGGLPTLAVRVTSVLQPGFRPSELGRSPVWIDYVGAPGTVPTVSMVSLLDGVVPASEVRGRIVVLGATDPTLHDLHSYSSLSSRPMAGAEIEANAIETALEHSPLRGAAGWVAMLLTLAVALVPLAVLGRGVPIGALILGGTLIAYLLAAQLLFDAGTIVPVANPAIALVATGAAALLVSFVLEIRSRAEQVTIARRRAVQAADEARRRVERDLHDGVQQRLIALAMRLSAPGAEAKPDLLRASVEQLKEALRELRELARGAYPAVLHEGGLEGALQSLADHAALPITLTTRELNGLNGDCARTAYFVAAEGLANAAKHAGAARVRIDAARVGAHLELTVADDGHGGANPRGSGLAGLTERAVAAGGSLRIASSPGAGTTLSLRIPV